LMEYKLATDLNQNLVNGIFDGYREYLEVRREKAKSLKVSGAYAWVKGNHIDHHVALACEAYGVESILSKAGLTWQYLQFMHNDEKILFVVKNARYFNEDQVNHGRDATGRTRNKKISYMEELMQINSGVDFNYIPSDVIEPSTQLELELIEDVRLSENDNLEISKIKSNYDRFYIVTYKIDEGQQIEEIRLWMPNPVNNKAYLIDDLTLYVNASHALDIDDELKTVLTNNDSDSYLEAHAFGIVLDDAKEKDN